MTAVKAVDPLDETGRGLDTKPLGASQAFTPEKVTRVPVKTEPVMRMLRRIFGDVVLDIFPAAFRQAVNDSYRHWVENPDSFLITDFDTEQDKLDSLAAMRAYSECADDGGYSIRTLADKDPCRLVWRAQTRRKIRGGE